MEIRKALKDFQSDFPKINEQLAMKREDVSDIMIEQILEAYIFLNELLKQDMKLFSPAGMHSLLELNHIVLCGRDPEQRMNYYHHITETRTRFMKRIKPIRTWVEKNREKSNPYKLAAKFYTLNLSQPQLFIEGNHRTGNIVLNYLLLSKNTFPFIITPKTAKEYLDISGEIKFTDKDNSVGNVLSLPKNRKRFSSLLKAKTDERYLEDV